MYSFKQYLTEIFDKPLPFKIQYSGSNDIASTGTFKTEAGLDYEVIFTPHLSFKYSKLPEDVRSKIAQGFVNSEAWEVFFHQKGEVGVTGTGQSISVFSTVMAMIQEWIKKTKPGIITFTAKEKTRVRLYRTIAKKISAKFIGEYKTQDGSGAVVLFVLEKK